MFDLVVVSDVQPLPLLVLDQLSETQIPTHLGIEDVARRRIDAAQQLANARKEVEDVARRREDGDVPLSSTVPPTVSPPMPPPMSPTMPPTLPPPMPSTTPVANLVMLNKSVVRAAGVAVPSELPPAPSSGLALPPAPSSGLALPPAPSSGLAPSLYYSN